jgi:hypothetical protein
MTRMITTAPTFPADKIATLADADVRMESPGCYRIEWADGSSSEAFPSATEAILALMGGKARRSYPVRFRDAEYLRECYAKREFTGD